MAPREKSLSKPEPVKPQAELPEVPAFTILKSVNSYGNPIWTVVCVFVQGDKVTKTVPVPEGRWDHVGDACEDMRRCISRAFKFGQLSELLAGKRGV